MSRTKRIIIAEPAIPGGVQLSFETEDRDVQTSPKDDYFTETFAPYVLLPNGHGVTSSVTVWGRGLISFGAPTPEQIDFMRHVDATDLSDFPGDFVAAAFDPEGFESIAIQGRRMSAIYVDGQIEVAPQHDELQITWSGEHSYSIELDQSGITFTGDASSPQQAGFHLGSESQIIVSSGTERLSFVDIFQIEGAITGDSLTGTYSAETISGTDGNDTIAGNGGPDVLLGGSGADDLVADGQGDRLIGGAGADLLHGADGNGYTYFVYTAATDSTAAAPDLITGFHTGEDAIDLRALAVCGTHISEVGNLYILTAQLADGSELLIESDRLIGVNDILTSSNLIGTTANDDLVGTSHNDRIIGGLGADTLTGGEGNNTFVYLTPADSTSDSPDTITDFAKGYYGSPIINVIDASAFVSTSYSLSDDDVLTIGSALGNLVIKIDSSFLFDESSMILNLHQAGTDDADYIDHSLLGGRVSLQGLDGADTLIGTVGDDTIDGGTGNDIISGGSKGVDQLFGGDGDDSLALYSGTVTGGDGTDTLRVDFSTATEPLSYGWVGDVLTAEAGDRSISASGIEAVVATGSAGNDTFAGGDFAEFLNGNAGRDQINGGAGDDTIWGGDGDDTIDAGSGNDQVLGGAGFDTYLYSGTDAVSINLAQGIASSTTGGTDHVGGIENACGGSGNDTLLAGSPTPVATTSGKTVPVDDQVITGAHDSQSTAISLTGPFETTRNDLIDSSTTIPHISLHATGGGYSDYYKLDASESGSTIIIDIDGAAQPDGGGFNASLEVVEVVLADDGTELLQDVAGVTTTTDPGSSNPGDPFLTVQLPSSSEGAYYYIIVGDQDGSSVAGHTYTLNVSVEDAILAYAPTLVGSVLSGGDGDDLLIGGAGNDTLDGGKGTNTASYVAASSGVSVSLADLKEQDTKGAGRDLLVNIERLIGSDHGDTLRGDSAANMIAGRSGQDTLYGGDGADTIDGGKGHDIMSGGKGDDTFIVDSSHDVIVERSGQGADTVLASVSYTLPDHVENLTLTGSRALSAAGNDGANVLMGNARSNVLSGHGGNDVLIGGSGDDTLLGGSGRDVLTGGKGADTFVFASAGVSKADADEITGFSHKENDQIDLTDLDAVKGGSIDAFTFIGDKSFDGIAGELRFRHSGTHTYIEADTNGDRISDLFIAIDGKVNLHATDFTAASLHG